MAGTGHDGRGERYLDWDAVPVVRPYAVTQGRTAPTGAVHVGLIDAVMATGEWPQPHFRPGPEQRRILELCHRPKPVVDLASETDLPVGVVRVLLGDLVSLYLAVLRGIDPSPVEKIERLKHALASG